MEEREEEAYVSAKTEEEDPTQRPGWRDFPRMLVALVRGLTFVIFCSFEHIKNISIVRKLMLFKWLERFYLN